MGIEIEELRLKKLLANDFDFHGEDSLYASHGIHSFPAKFPPQIPYYFINKLTKKGENVLDPMMGSGTAIVEGAMLGRNAFGIDLDPLAYKITKVKVTPISEEDAWKEFNRVEKRARHILFKKTAVKILNNSFDEPTKKFLNYWFTRRTQEELVALSDSIGTVEELKIKEFLELIFSSIIITKTGGVSLATDLAHSRPHKVAGKIAKNALDQFSRRFKKTLENIYEVNGFSGKVNIQIADARKMPYKDSFVDLIVTSPPYVSNAIDYMRAHKFSLVWFGYPINKLSELRREYIGAELDMKLKFEELPEVTLGIIRNLYNVDKRKAKHLFRYVSDMGKVFSEMKRVLKPGKCAVVIIGSSTLRGIDVKTQELLAETGIKKGLGFIGITERALDRDKRMLPASNNKNSTIQDRMHKEYIIGFYKKGES